MTTLSDLLETPAATTLAWTLLHFLWQGAVLAVLLASAIKLLRLSAAGRYAAGVVTLAVMLAAPVVTFVVASRQEPVVPVAARALTDRADSAAGLPIDAAALSPNGGRRDVSIAAIVVALWAAGVTVLAMRLLGGWWLARGLVRRGARPVAPEIESMAVRIAGRLALDRVVRIAQSSAVAVPVMVGWLKPIVLFPASVLGGLSPTQIEALLAHELAHVRRHDYLVNLLQSVVETMLFYHPAVWWVSGRVRVEREHCCDDIALSVCDRLVYATALSDLAALASPPQVALAATDGSLLQRVRRILAGEDTTRERGAGWLPVLGVLIVAGLIVPVAWLRARADVRAESVMADQAAGVVSGVSGGVSGGVARGVPGGVVGGVAGGVPGGVVGGVAGGVEGTVPNRLALSSEAQDRQTREQARSAQTEQEREALARKIAALQADAEARLRQIEEARTALAQERIDAQYRARLNEHQIELEALIQERARMRRMVEVGTLTPEHLAAADSKIKQLEQRLAALQAERNIEQRELELRAEEERRKRELEKAMVELQRSGDLYALTREREARQSREGVKQLYEQLDQLMRSEELYRSATPLGDQEPIRSGDVLVIEIAGEPDVPRAYTVSGEGTIRLPLSPSIRVAGLTGAQVEELIVKQLSARGLQRTSVNIALRRPKGE